MCQTTKPVYEIDGACFDTLEGFFDEIARVFLNGRDWGRNLDAFDEILDGTFRECLDEPQNGRGFLLIWKNADLSRKRLGYAETIRQLERRLEHCHPGNHAAVSSDLENARQETGPTVFDWLLSQIADHGFDGKYPNDAVELKLA